MTSIDENAKDILFRKARTFNAWTDKPVEDSVLKEIHDLCKWGPTSANCCPMRLVFVKSKEAKERFKPCLAQGNDEKMMEAPVTVIIGYDMEFYEKLPKLFPHADARSWFAGNPEKIKETAFRNGTLQGAYLMLAARGLGLDCGPMSGFDNAKVDAEFFKGTTYKSNFICSLGYGDASRKLFPRSPRFEFDEIAKIV
jgi:3-hydroxypropanoate dehydrogenase